MILSKPGDIPKLTKKDFVSGQEVRWCPGCGDYAILAQIQKLMPELGVPKENVVFVSGIGCASRFPYYMNTFGFHTIHGRAPAIATGLKAVNGRLQVWIITGDGDALSIGGNHMLHLLRRNVDVKVVLFNNRVYGLTKGQASPTSPRGTRSKTTPDGSIDNPVEPIRFAVAARASFVARSIDNHVKHLTEVLGQAARHKGTAFVEVYQNCVVFNDGAFSDFAVRKERDEHTLDLRQGEPMLFGKERDKGLLFDGRTFRIVPADHPDVLVHDERSPDSTIIYGLARLQHPEFPVPIGVFRSTQEGSYAESFEERLDAQIEEARAAETRDLQALLAGPHTWEVGEDH